MLSKRKLLERSSLYLILDPEVQSYDQLFETAREAITAGVDIVQLRDKHGNARDMIRFSKKLLALTREKVPYIINDRVDLALAVGASGVHLGQDDFPLEEARQMLGAKAIIGVSCQRLNQVREAQHHGADYIGFGSVFKTLTKPDRNPMDLKVLQQVVSSINIPVFAIGGITLGNIAQIKSLGASRFAVCRAICEAKNIKQTVRSFKNKI